MDRYDIITASPTIDIDVYYTFWEEIAGHVWNINNVLGTYYTAVTNDDEDKEINKTIRTFIDESVAVLPPEFSDRMMFQGGGDGFKFSEKSKTSIKKLLMKPMNHNEYYINFESVYMPGRYEKVHTKKYENEKAFGFTNN